MRSLCAQWAHTAEASVFTFISSSLTWLQWITVRYCETVRAECQRTAGEAEQQQKAIHGSSVSLWIELLSAMDYSPTVIVLLAAAFVTDCV